MLPALKTGLVADDLMQRAVELRPGQLPARMHETGNPADSGSLATVLRDLFRPRPESAKHGTDEELRHAAVVDAG